VNINDSQNFLLFLQQLKKTLAKQVVGRTIRLTAAVSITPFVDSSGAPMTNVAEFANVLDYIGVSAALQHLTRMTG
jgi:chitinase